MTASVSTRGMKGARYTDLEREQMYIGALSYYLHNLMNSDPQQKIVFAENSGWDLNRLMTALSEYDLDRVEFIALPKEAFDISRGKGYNELLLINMAIERSAAIQERGAFFKVTGRYPIYNLSHFIRKASDALDKGVEFYCDVKDHRIFDLLHLGWCGHAADARLFAVKVPYYQQHIGCRYHELNDYSGRLLEGLLFQDVKQAYGKGLSRFTGVVGNGKIKARFSREPVFGGMEGSMIDAISFSTDQNSSKNKIKRLIGNGFRLFLPWIWI
jgi:hypothetical protein